MRDTLRENTDSVASSEIRIWEVSRLAGRNIPYVFLAIVLLAAFSFRLYWMATRAPVISIEGAEYVRMAQNLRAGRGLVGNFEGPETMYTPLYSIFIAGAWSFVGSGELAGHVVSLLLGTALLLPAFFITSYIYGRRTAYLAAVLVAIYPYLIARAGSIYTESIYPTFLLAGLYWGIRSVDLRGARNYLLCGASFGLAYLTRPEAFAYPIFFAVTIFAVALARRRGFASSAIPSLLVLASFAVVASPYVAFLYAHTGRVQFEGKWNINYTMGNRIASGMGIYEAADGIDDLGQEQGPFLNFAHYASYTPYAHSLMDKLRYMLSAVGRNRYDAYSTLLDTSFGEPILLMLVVIALFRGPWDRSRLIYETILLTIAFSIVVLMLTANFVQFRYADPLVALSIPWAAKGLKELGDWGGNCRAHFAKVSGE